MPSEVLQLSPKGLRCVSGKFHLDPWRPVDIAVISHAHSDHARFGSKLYHATPDTAAILRKRLGEDCTIAEHPYRETFRLGNAKVSFHSAGHVLGSAQVRVEVDGKVWVFSGDYKRQSDLSCEPFEVVPCDTFITEATFALPIYRWQSTEQIAAQVLAWWTRERNRNRNCLIACYSLGKAQRLIAELRRLTAWPIYTHGAVEAINEIYRRQNRDPGATTPAMEMPAKERGALIVCPPSALQSTWTRRFGDAATAFASGWMQVRGTRRREGFDQGFALSDHADFPDLVRTVKETGASRVLVTHGSNDAFSRYLREQGIAAEPLVVTEFSGEAEE